MSTIEEIKAAVQNLSDVVNAFEAPTAPLGVAVAEVAKVESEIATVDTELKADITPNA